MSEQTEIHGMWWFRNETLADAVERVTETFKRLGKITPLWDPWYRSYRNFADRERPAVRLSGHPELILEEFEADQRIDNMPRSLGYSLRAFAGPEKGKRMEKSELVVSCCHLPPHSGFNYFSIELPTMGPQGEKLRNVQVLAGAVAVLVDIWDPDSVMVGDLLKKMVPWPNNPFLGWINYLSLRVASVTDLPAGWRWWDERKGRQIFIHDRGMPSPENPDHVAAYRGLSQHIRWEAPPQGIVPDDNSKVDEDPLQHDEEQPSSGDEFRGRTSSGDSILNS